MERRMQFIRLLAQYITKASLTPNEEVISRLIADLNQQLEDI